MEEIQDQMMDCGKDDITEMMAAAPEDDEEYGDLMAELDDLMAEEAMEDLADMGPSMTLGMAAMP